MQEGLTISGRAITGTLKELMSGQLVTDWGAGYFMALQFANIEPGAVVRVGLDPSQGSGLVELDNDRNGVFKVTDKDAQVFVVETTLGGVVKTDEYDLSGLTLAE